MSLLFPVIIAAALVGLPQDAAQSTSSSQSRQSSSKTQTDQTVNVQKGTRLELPDCSGEVVIKTWDRDAVRVQATHRSRERVNVTSRNQVLLIESGASGRPGFVDFDLTVPASMDLRIEGHSCSAEIAGVAGSVSVETVEGDIVLRDLSGTVDARTVEGKVSLIGGRGKVAISTVDDDIEISKASGEISAESIEGDIKLTDVQATVVDVSTVDGDIFFSGALQASGRYQFNSHGGSVDLVIPENSSATFGVRAYSGSDLRSSLPIKPVGEVRRGRRTTYTLGSGSAKVEIETFDGSVSIRKPGEIKKER